ncbi:MAG: hypothetical protein K2W80_14100, partial [Burkholderiales bacterium]|nr:hypothetical protein [Burkholderiales bacterium]
MPPVGIENQAYGQLAGAVLATDVVFTLQSGQGARFGAFPAGMFKTARVVRTDGTLEYVKITSRSGDALTVARGQQGSAAITFSINDRIEIVPDKGTMAEFVQRGLLEQMLVAGGTADAIT